MVMTIRYWKARANNGMPAEPERLVWSALARFMVVALFFDALAPLFPQISASYGISADRFQSILGASYIAFAMSQLASVHAIKILGLFRTAAMSCLYLGIASALICIFEDPSLFAICFVSMFVVNGIGSNATRVALREATTDDRFRRLFGWASGAVQIKQIFMPLLAGTLAVTYGWRSALLVLAAPVILAGIFIEFSTLNRAKKQGAELQSKSIFSRWAAVIVMPSFLRPTLTAAAFQIAFGPLTAQLPFLLSERSGFTSTSVGLTLSAASAAIAIGFFISAHLSAKISSASMIMLGIIVMIVGSICVIVGNFYNLMAVIVGIIIIQSSIGFVMTACSGDALSASDTNRTTASALFGFLQPTVGGLAVIVAGNWTSSGVVVIITLCAISIFSIILVRYLIGNAKNLELKQ